MYFPMFGCLILHQRNTERSGTEMEERSREHFPMFGCLILHQRNTERSGTEMEERSRECIFQCSVTLMQSEAERNEERRKNRQLGKKLHCSSGVPIVVITVPFRSVGTGGGLYQSLSLGAERNSKEIEREGGREIKWERYFYLLTIPFRSVFL